MKASVGELIRLTRQLEPPVATPAKVTWID
jgi:hypothetical protein